MNVYPIQKHGSVTEKAATQCVVSELQFGVLIPAAERAGSFWTEFIITPEPRDTQTEKKYPVIVFAVSCFIIMFEDVKQLKQKMTLNHQGAFLRNYCQ